VAHYTAGLQQLHGWLLRLEQIHQQQQQQQQQQEQQQQGGSTLSSAAGGWGLTPEAVKWARSAVWSRAFTIKELDIGSNRLGLTAGGSSQAAQQQDMAQPGQAVTGPGSGDPAAAAASAGGSDGDAGGLAPVIALVPVLDMCDHQPQQRVSWRTVTLGDQQQQQNGTEQPQNGTQQQAPRPQAFQFTSLSPVAKVGVLVGQGH
jgi:hypothetical protein